MAEPQIVNPQLLSVAGNQYLAKYVCDFSNPQTIDDNGWDKTLVTIMSDAIRTPKNWDGIFRTLVISYVAGGDSVLKIRVRETGLVYFIGNTIDAGSTGFYQSSNLIVPIFAPQSFTIDLVNNFNHSEPSNNLDRAVVYLSSEKQDPFATFTLSKNEILLTD